MEVTRLKSDCISCIIKKHLTAYPEDAKEHDKIIYMKRILKAVAEAENYMSAPEIVERINKIKENFFGKTDDFAEVKKHFNNLMLKEEKALTEEIKKYENPLKRAFLIAMKGNYIDFGAMYKVDENVLKNSLYGITDDGAFDGEFSNLVKDLEKAKKLLYITDNCGEIVADKLFIKEIMKEFPDISVTALVRGREVLNDATLSDAKDVGLDDMVKVITNGTGIPGTSLSEISYDAKKAVFDADVIISKGQGNFETLMYSRLNIYYIFMCKCKMFAERFNVEPFTGMLLNDMRMY